MKNITYLIIEDEDPAANRLRKMVEELAPTFTFVTHIVSVKSAIKWFTENEHPDLAFMDIQLADGTSFEIFKHVIPKCPVIFTTAYDQFAVQAFKINSIDYLLKPIKKEELKEAIDKFKLRVETESNNTGFSKIAEFLKSQTEYQKRLLIRFGETIKAVEIKDVAYFYTENKIHYLSTFDKKIYSVDNNLDQLEGILDPKLFFRINRQFIVNVNAINKMVTYSKSRVKLELNPPTDIETIVSTERSPNFKDWLTGLQ